MNWKLEVVVVPVTDVDRAKTFYVEKLGFHLDVDTWPTETMRVVQMTPPGSACSVTIGPVILAPGVPRGPGSWRRRAQRTGRLRYQVMRTSRTPLPSGERTENASGERSMMRPAANGPRSSMTTITVRPVARSVTVTCVPNGIQGLAAVRPDHAGSYHVA